MTVFDDEHAENFEALLEIHGETIGYYASGIPSVPMPEVEAIVSRGQPDGSGLGRVPQVVTGLVIDVAMADVPTVTVGKTAFVVAERVGGSALTWKVQKIIRQTGGVWRLKLA